ncbi:hypothetical protein M5689_016426 [Euphorbia peplus]|nr:hypothetical protein M5689_016426 [Euphorbia peplus]
MELRSCSHLHSIQALRGGMVMKVLNFNHGRPALKFREVKCLYEGDTEVSEVNPAFQPKFECVDSPFECDVAKAESLCTLTREAQKIRSDETSASKSQDNAVEESELGDLNCANITLKQIKERCKEKKRKRSKWVNMSKESTETCPTGERSHFSSQSEDEYDTMEPLICLKLRILKMKAKRKCKKTSSLNALSIVEFEAMPTEIIFQTEEDTSAPIAIKVEFPEPTFSDCKDLVVTSSESPVSWIEPAIYYAAVSSEELKTANGYNFESGIFIREPYISESLVLGSMISVIPGEELLSNACGMEIHKPFLLSYTPESSAGIEESYEELGGAENFVRSVIPVEELRSEAFSFETPVPALLTDKPHFCVNDSESHGNEDYADADDVLTSGGKKLIDGIAEVVCDQLPDLSFLEARKEDSVTEQLQENDHQLIVSPDQDHNTVTCNELHNFPSPYLKSQKTCSNNEVQVIDIIDDTHDLEEPSQGNDSHLPNPEDEVEVHNHVPARIIDSPRDCDSHPISNFSSSQNCSSDSVVECHNEPVVTKVEECHHSEFQQQPERLLSTRMAISPTSQKKLREAMDSLELDHKKYYDYARKMCYGNLMESKTGKLEGGNQNKKAEVITSPKKAVKKRTIDSNGFRNIKPPQVPRAAQNVGAGRNSVRSCPESAILFSQQQLRDFESITAKLTKELQFMKDIAEETLQYKVDPDASLRYSENEIKNAIQNATRIEETAKRSLSIMARDCSRFCKIMKLAEKSSGTVINKVQKKRKIIFADEAGGKLCDVKTFQNDVDCE